MSVLRSLALGAAMIGASGGPAHAIDTHRPEVKQFVARMAEEHAFSKRRLRKLLRAAQTQPAIIEAMDRPAEKAKLWYEYRATFISDKRIQTGVDFWITHREELERAASMSGVAPEYLVAILGVETYYGRLTGRYRILDALCTLAFDYPARSKFFQDELEQFLLLTREAGVDPLTATGSYAGAMGAPQFMPSNYRRYAVDAAQDGHIDLWTNWPDILVSVGNYMKEHGWNAGEPVLSEASAETVLAEGLDGRQLALSETVGSLKAKGVAFDSLLPMDAPALLVAADEADGVHWRVGYNNFYVITRYNHSALYAMAVYELATELKSRVAANDALSAGTTAGTRTPPPMASAPLPPPPPLASPPSTLEPSTLPQPAPDTPSPLVEPKP